jgi:Fe-Mn family superoxide dismutase
MDEHNLDRRSFLRGLAGAAVIVTGLSEAAAEEPSASMAKAGQKTVTPDIQKYRGLIGTLEGFSATIIREHLALLERYRQKFSEVESQNRTIDLALADPLASRWRNHVLAWIELHNSVRLHELYFDALTPKSVKPDQKIGKALKESYGSFDQWWVKFRATAMAVRAWGVLAWDNQSRRLVIFGLDNDSEWPLGLEPLLVVDMAEHAYVLDFIGQPLAYLDAWLARVNWLVVDSRLARASEK